MKDINTLDSDRCIIFDMDGVLINSEPLHFDFESKFFESLGISVSRKQHETFVGTTNKTMWENIKKTHKLPFTVSELIEKGQSDFLDYLEHNNSLEPIPGIIDLLNRLQDSGYIPALASSSPQQFINYVLDKCKIEEYFQTKISGDDVKNGKPDPEIFLKTAQMIGLKPEKCLVIEDSEHGVNAAIQAGMKCIGFSNPGSGNQNLSSADLIIKSFNALTIPVIHNLFI